MSVRKKLAAALVASAVIAGPLAVAAPASAAAWLFRLCAQSGRAAKVTVYDEGAVVTTLGVSANTCGEYYGQAVDPGFYEYVASQQLSGGGWTYAGTNLFDKEASVQIYVKTVNGHPTAEFYVA